MYIAVPRTQSPHAPVFPVEIEEASASSTTELALESCAQISPWMRTAMHAAKIGGEIVAKHFYSGTTIHSKSKDESFNLVSAADLESEKAICSCIHNDFPDHAILGEEEAVASTDAKQLWVIDPLDGTNNFAHQIPHFAISIAYYQDGEGMAGVVYNPIRGDLYWAEKGSGAFYNGRPIHISGSSHLNEVIVAVGFYYDRGALMEATLAAIHSYFKSNIHGIRRFGAAALDLCAVADGQYGAFMEYQLSPWDFAAGRIILEEAGGKITTARGEPLMLSKTGILASNGLIHDQALEISKRHHP